MYKEVLSGNGRKNRYRIYIDFLLKCCLFIFVFLFNSQLTSGQHTWLWESSAFSNHFSSIWAVKTNQQGESYVTGEFRSDTCFLDSNYVTGNWGATNIFVAKFSTSGNCVWAKPISCPSALATPSFSTDIGIDSFGNCFITGNFTGPIIFNNSITITGGGIFLAKYDSSGNFSWVVQAGNNMLDRPYSITVDEIGNSYITGISTDTTVFSNDTLTITSAFIAKYNSNGTLIWLLPFQGSGSQIGFSIHIDKLNRLLVTGLFSDTLTIGNQQLISANVNYSDVFVSKFDSSGNLIWLKSVQGINDDRGMGITTDNLGNVFVTGQFSDTLQFASQTFTTNNNTTDIFIAKYDSSGNELWFKQAGGTFNGDEGQSIITDNLGNCIVRGKYKINCTFNANTIYSNGDFGYFIAIYNPIGILNELKPFITSYSGGSINANNTFEFGISSDQYSNIYTVGILDTGITIFDNDTIFNLNTTPQAIILKLGCQINPPTITYNGNVLLSTNATAYQWFYGSLPIAGANQQSLVPVGNGDYQVLITDSNGCKSTSNIYSHIDVGTNEFNSALINLIFPNPANSIVNVLKIKSFVRIQFFDRCGKEVLSSHLKTIDVSHLANGIYIYKIWGDSGIFLPGRIVILN